MWFYLPFMAASRRTSSQVRVLRHQARRRWWQINALVHIVPGGFNPLIVLTSVWAFVCADPAHPRIGRLRTRRTRNCKQATVAWWNRNGRINANGNCESFISVGFGTSPVHVRIRQLLARIAGEYVICVFEFISLSGFWFADRGIWAWMWWTLGRFPGARACRRVDGACSLTRDEASHWQPGRRRLPWRINANIGS